MVRENKELRVSSQVPSSGDQASNVDAPVEEAVNAEGDLPPTSEKEIRLQQGIDPPPNGGLTAWLQVLGSFFLFFNCWSVVVNLRTHLESSKLVRLDLLADSSATQGYRQRIRSLPDILRK